MAWSARHVFTYGEVPTAANLNTNFANMDETAPAKVTTKADVVVATGANAIARVPLGAVRYWGLITNPAETSGTKAQPVPTQLDYNYASYTVSNTASETDTWSYSLAAGALGAKEFLKIAFDALFLNNYGAGQTFTIKFYIGSTSYSVTSAAHSSSVTKYAYSFDIEVRPNNATNSQDIWLNFIGGGLLGSAGSQKTFHYWGAEANDMSAAKTLKVSFTLSNAGTGLTMQAWHPTIIVYPGMT